MDVRQQLENLRSVIFLGKERTPNDPYITQEQYIELYEERLERDALAEFKALEKAAAPLLPYFEKKLEQIAKMEAFLRSTDEDHAQAEDDFGDSDDFEKDSVLESLHEEIASMDTEEQWIKFVENW